MQAEQTLDSTDLLCYWRKQSINRVPASEEQQKKTLCDLLFKVYVFDYSVVGFVHPDGPDVCGGQREVHQSLLWKHELC